jgi:hypothetical protein
MMKSTRVFLGAFVVLAGAAIFWLTQSSRPGSKVADKAETAMHEAAPAHLPPEAKPLATPMPDPPMEDPPPGAPPALVQPQGEADAVAVSMSTASISPAKLRSDLGDVQLALRDYRTGLGENPVGNNAEITKALLGANLKQLKIPVPTGSQVNADGELCDRFGTPYFFHQLSGTQMEIRSAGPDRKMWTADDVQR